MLSVDAAETTDENRQEAFQNVMLAYHLAHLACVPSSNNHEVLRTLDEYCDPKTFQESRKPLTLLGGNGVGKSALLAAWIRQRQNSVIAKKDMVIYHFAGCNNTSTEVRNFLYRCCSRLSKFFRLKSSVTFDEEHLTWDFPRMLEFCANKGRIIVVIDGLEMLHLVERQDNLRWLPLNFPGNVRVILSFRTSVLPKRFEEKQSNTFITDSADESSDQEEEHINQAMQRMHAELFKRRQLPYVQVKPLRDAERTLLAKALCELPYPREKKEARPKDEEEDGEEGDEDTPEEPPPPPVFRIFPKMFEELLASPMAQKSTRALLVMVKTMRELALVNRDLWGACEQMFAAETEEELLQTVIKIWETSSSPLQIATERKKACEGAGGLEALNKGTTLTVERIVKKAGITRTAPSFADILEHEGTTRTLGFNLVGGSVPLQVLDGEKDEKKDEVEEMEISFPEEEGNLDSLPKYLVGGEDYKGFGKAFRVAVALLCSAQYGLKPPELWGLLAQADCEIGGAREKERKQTFLKALEAMGLMRIQELLVFPPSFKVLYVTAAKFTVEEPDQESNHRKDVEAEWISNMKQSHLRIFCKYFSRLPRHRRRMEELPFALRTCSEWVLLKDEVCNVHTFRKICHNGHQWKANLTCFWRLLASGIQSGSDEWFLGRPSPRHYDPVDEFTRSVSHYALQEKPSTRDLSSVIVLILRFLEDFAQYESRVPDFLHPHIKMHSLGNIRITDVAPSGSDPFYFYNRWLWVMFPWLALANAHSKDVIEKLTTITKPPKEEPSITQKGFWKSRKISTTVPIQVNSISKVTSKVQGYLKAHAMQNKTRKPLEIGKTVLSGSERKALRFKRSDKMRVPWGPHSAQSVKTVKRGTRFPSVEAHFKEKGERMYNIFSGGALGKRSLPTSHKLTTAHLNNVPAHLSCYPITEADAKLAESTGSLYQLRERHDQLTYECRMKRKQLDALRQDVAEREKQDAFTEKCIRNGEAMMIELEQRLRQVQQALNEARRTHAFYKEILKVCEKNPYKEYRQLNSREKLATTAKRELSSVMQKYHALEYELNHLETKEKANLQKEVASARELESSILEKLDDMKSRLQTDHKLADTLNDRRREIVSELAGDLNRKAEQKLKSSNTAQQLYNKHLTMTANHSKRKLIKIQNVFRKIADVTGLNDPQAILNKWMNKDNEEGALLKQRQEFQLKLAKLQEEKRNLQKELDSANFGDRIMSSHQIRHIDDLSFQAETKLKRNQEKYLKSQSLLKDVKGGVIHLATMLNLRSGAKLEHEDPEEILKVIREKVKELRKTQDNDDVSLERLPTPPTNERLLVGRIVGKYQLEQEAETNKNLGVDSSIHTNMARYGLQVLAKLDELDDGAAAITSPTKQPLLPLLSSADSVSPLLEQAVEEVIEDPPVLSRQEMKAQVDELERRERTRRKRKSARGKSATSADNAKKETLAGTRRRVIPGNAGAARRFTAKNPLF